MSDEEVGISWVNIFNQAELSASSAATNLPVTRLKQKDVIRKWRGTNGDNESVFGSYDSPQNADLFCLFGINLLLTGTFRLRLSDSDPTCEVFTFDSGVILGRVDPLYKYLIYVANEVKTGWLHFRWDITQVGAEFIQAGRGWIGTLTRFDHPPALGTPRSIPDASLKRKTLGLQLKITKRPSQRVQEMTFNMISEAQRWSVFEAIDLSVGSHDDVVLIRNTQSDNLGRDTMFGVMENVEPVTGVIARDEDGNEGYSRSIKIEERK